MGWLVFLKDKVGPNGERIRGQLNPEGYAPYALVVGGLMVFSILVACLATQRFIPFLHQPAADHVRGGRIFKAVHRLLRIGRGDQRAHLVAHRVHPV